MTDAELVRWLQTGSVVLIGEQPPLPLDRPPTGVDTREAFDTLAATYDPCRAQTAKLCLYCPWEMCRMPKPH